MTNTDQSKTFHGVFVDVFGHGVLLVGNSGIGKSELALGLINRGHRLVADDSVTFGRRAQKILGACSPVLQDFLEVRGLGILNIRAMFGDTAIKMQKSLHLIVRIINLEGEDLANIDRFCGVYTQTDVLGVHIPEVTIPVAPGRNLAVLVEAAVRNQLLKNTGYNATELFKQRQRQFMQEQQITQDDSQ